MTDTKKIADRWNHFLLQFREEFHRDPGPTEKFDLYNQVLISLRLEDFVGSQQEPVEDERLLL